MEVLKDGARVYFLFFFLIVSSACSSCTSCTSCSQYNPTLEACFYSCSSCRRPRGGPTSQDDHQLPTIIHIIPTTSSLSKVTSENKSSLFYYYFRPFSWQPIPKVQVPFPPRTDLKSRTQSTKTSSITQQVSLGYSNMLYGEIFFFECT